MKKNNLILLATSAISLAACQETLRPSTSNLDSNLNPQKPLISSPVAIPAPATPEAGSLWVPGSRQFFKDSRAHAVGDIITVTVSEEASAATEAKTGSSRSHSQQSGISGLPFIKGQLESRGIPLGPTDLVDTSSARSFSGNGKTDRKDSLTANIAAVVMQVLPNGLLVIQGQREVVVNYEKQTLQITGIIRTEDISSANTIPSTKIAEARITYAGRGTVDESQTPQYGVRWLDKILPF